MHIMCVYIHTHIIACTWKYSFFTGISQTLSVKCLLKIV